MEINLYSNLDPRHLLPSAYKSFADIAPLLGGPGEPISIDSQTKTVFNGTVPVMRDLTLKGKYTISLILHGNVNLTLDNAELENNNIATSTIMLASDFTGTVSIINSTVKYHPQNPTLESWALATDATEAMSARAQKIMISNSAIQGIAINPTALTLDGNVDIEAPSAKTASIINTSFCNASSANLKVSYLRLINPSKDTAQIRTLTLINGPVELDGKWTIDELIVNARSSRELFKFSGQICETEIQVGKLTINKAPRGLSVFYAENAILKFSHAQLGDQAKKYGATISNCIVEMKQSMDYLHWNFVGQNGVDLDETSISELRNRKNEYQAVDMNRANLNAQASAKQMVSQGNNDYGSNVNDLDNLDDTQNTPQNDNQNSNQPSDQKPTDDKNNIGMPTKQDLDDKKVITQKDSTRKSIEQDDPMAKLNSLIGLGAVKKTIASFIDTEDTNQLLKSRGLKISDDLAMHMVLAGSPGTGKTTVARLLTQILYQHHVIRKNVYKEYTSKDLVTENVGGTTEKTHKAIEAAKGGVMLIDEAYMLNAKGNSFGREALDEVMDEMENDRSDLIVILAGYPEEMHKLVYETNPGLQSRIGVWIDFPNYSEKELYEIFNMMCKQKGLLVDQRFLKTKMFKYCMYSYQQAYYDKKHRLIQNNARGVRQFVDELYRLRNTRIAHMANAQALSNEQLISIVPNDIKEAYQERRKYDATHKFDKRGKNQANDPISNDNVHPQKPTQPAIRRPMPVNRRPMPKRSNN